MRGKIFVIAVVVVLLATGGVLLPVSAGTPSVTRTLPSGSQTEGDAITVSLNVVVGSATYYLIDEVVPAGWAVTGASGRGDYTSQPGHVKWAVIVGAADTTLTYAVTIPAGAAGAYTFSGTYGMEGMLETTTGGDTTVIVGDITALTPTPAATATPEPTPVPTPTPEPNTRPSTPTISEAPTSGTVRTTYTFKTAATDPDGDELRCRLDWGDGLYSDWSSLVSSGSSVSRFHSWSKAGTYQVRVQVQDAHGATSSWSSPINVTISRAPTPTSSATATPTPVPASVPTPVATPAPAPAATPLATPVAAPTPAPEPTATPTPTPTQTPTPEEPGFEAVFALSSPVVAAYPVVAAAYLVVLVAFLAVRRTEK